ncbi:MAG: hypothetical protein ACU0B1_07565, partial [Thermohalobaculum sp.]
REPWLAQSLGKRIRPAARLRGAWRPTARQLAETGLFAAQCPAIATKEMTSVRLGVSWPAAMARIHAPALLRYPVSEI